MPFDITFLVIVLVILFIVLVGCLWRYCPYVPDPLNLRYVYNKYNRPKSRKDKVEYKGPDGSETNCCLAVLKGIGAWMRIYCPCSFNFTNSLKLEDAIDRYGEFLPESSIVFMKNLSENVYLNITLSYLSQMLPRFYFKILPSGSLRERFGYKLPSTSVLSTDYDLMLVPDGIYVYDQDAELDSNFPPAFIAIDDPNQNPTTPSGYLWLSLKEQDLTEWKQLCYQRLMKNGVEFFLSQLAVLDMLRQNIGSDAFVKFLRLVMTIEKSSSISVNAVRSGPAITIIAKQEAKELFHADFTLAIFCPVFPKCAHGNEISETDSEADSERMAKLSEEIVNET